MVKNLHTQLPAWVKYSIALLMVVTGTFLKIRFFDIIGHQTPLLLYFGIVLLASRFLGFGPAVFSLAISIAGVAYFFMSPYHSFKLDVRQIVQLLVFGAECLLIIKVANALEKALKKNVSDISRFRAIIEKSSDAIVVVNKEGMRTYCSPSVMNIVGYSAEEFCGMTPWMLGHPDEVEDIRQKFTELSLHPGEAITLLHRMKHKAGHWIWVESRVTNSMNDPTIDGMISNFNDVSKKVEMEQVQRDFIGVVSHELKNPLTNIKSYGQLLDENLRAAGDMQSLNLTTRLIQQADRMNKMLIDLVELATINAGTLRLEMASFDFNGMVGELLEGLQLSTRRHLLKSDLAILESITADKEKIRQVLINLISNAIKYTPAGGDIHISSVMQESSLLIKIKDTGIGIPQQEIELIFNRLYRVAGKKGITGLGLGLYISKQIVQAHHGEMGVESNLGEGSVFWFTLPFSPQGEGIQV